MTNDLAMRTGVAPYLMAAKSRFDAAVMRYDAWFLVFTAVILALGATVVLGAAVWCITKGHGSFTGSFSFKNFGLKVNLECR
ncbi:hypothetical protein Aph02nite_09900 [Actinoplanes philippinensis]|uniref:Uncharacterized protein n=1 Tax=Actinoplanes philippinensis TaxID=35752 RepID=A0A1I2A9Y3_9ACTN|nr:hypothetical protein [Actinoplanes philippinensis]GIE75040.1 hypothetical protein Aph02nite_09900 [Actinoplanes philippinensis]SFE39793.1 hypothetical protein SAMN05421541_101552 [Actinoplanes philippinensis]